MNKPKATTLRTALAVGVMALLAATLRPGVALASGGAGVCTIILPDHPLSAAGLATPYELQSVPGVPACHEGDPNSNVFVQAVIYDPATGALSVYNPLVIDFGTHPAIAPAKVTLPVGAVVGIWIGSNGNELHPEMSFPGSHCVLTYKGSPYGQEAWCNAPNFYTAVEAGIASGMVHVPALGVALDGMACPTVRDYSVVDQDPDDNVVARELVTASGRSAQYTAANLAALPGASVVFNGSDEGTLGRIDSALGCKPWAVPVANDPGVVSASLPLNELMAKYDQPSPVATVEVNDPFTFFYENRSLGKLNAYRAARDQPAVASMTAALAYQVEWCQQVLGPNGVARIFNDRPYTQAASSPFPNVANSLFTFLAQRWQNTFVGPLGMGADCSHVLHVSSPVSITYTNGIATDATYTP